MGFYLPYNVLTIKKAFTLPWLRNWQNAEVKAFRKTYLASPKGMTFTARNILCILKSVQNGVAELSYFLQ